MIETHRSKETIDKNKGGKEGNDNKTPRALIKKLSP
jgi:hypothetical protein